VQLDDVFYGSPSLLVEGQLALQSADGKVDAHWPALLRSRLGEAAVQQVDLRVEMKSPERMTDLGIPGADVDEFDSAFFSFMLAVSAAQPGGDASSVMGELKVTGFKFAPCAADPAAPPPDQPADMPGSGEQAPDRAASPSTGMGTAGCRGADMIDVLSGSFMLP
jgi:hypothetical protein